MSSIDNIFAFRTIGRNRSTNQGGRLRILLSKEDDVLIIPSMMVGMTLEFATEIDCHETILATTILKEPTRQYIITRYELQTTVVVVGLFF